MKKTALSVEEMRKELGLGRNIAYEMVRMSGFPAIRIGKKIIVTRAGLERWLEQNEGKELTK